MRKKRVKLVKLRALKRRRTLGKRVRREIRSLRRWSTLFLALWGYFKLTKNPERKGYPPGPSKPPS